MRLKPVAVVAAAVAVDLFASACGSEGEGEGVSATTTTTAPAPTTTTPPADKDKAGAQASVLTAAEVGEGYADDDTDSDTTGEDQDVEEAAFQACASGNALLRRLEDGRSADSEFLREDSGRVVSRVDFAAKTEEAEKAFDVVALDQYTTCLRDEVKKAVTAEAEAEVNASVTSERVPITLSDADEATRVRTDAMLTGPKGRLRIVSDFVIARKGRAVAILFLTHLKTPFPDADVVRLSGLVVKRASAYAA